MASQKGINAVSLFRQSLLAEVDRLDRLIIEALGQQGIATPNTQFLMVITSPYYEPK